MSGALHFEVAGEVEDREIIAIRESIHELRRLRSEYGAGRWRKLKGTATVRLADGNINEPRFIGMKRTALAKDSSRSRGSGTKPPRSRPRRKPRFVLCITDAEPDLELRKVYEVLPDLSAAKNNYLRVVDESGDDYLYPGEYFVPVELPRKAASTLEAAGLLKPADSA